VQAGNSLAGALFYGHAVEGIGMTVFAEGILAGFECSSHRRMDGVRVDVLASTQHDRLAADDYRKLVDHGISVARDGVRWHCIEFERGRFDWSGFRSMICAAERAGIQIVWDLCHYGYPDHVNLWEPDLVERFAAYARRLAEIVRDEYVMAPIFCPINEISFWSWAGGEAGCMNPGTLGRGDELKKQLVRAALAATKAIKKVDPRARFICAEPIIEVLAANHDDADAAHNYRQSQYHAADMLLGMRHPELGGSHNSVDVVGVNFYPSNQWFLNGGVIPLGHHLYRPLRAMLQDLSARYPGKEILIAETGAEGSARSAWLHYVCGEVVAARELGVPVTGICIYPVLDYPGWENERPCEVGLFGPGPDRPIHQDFVAEVRRQQARMRPSYVLSPQPAGA
jgi:hypothetical protein